MQQQNTLSEMEWNSLHVWTPLYMCLCVCRIEHAFLVTVVVNYFILRKYFFFFKNLEGKQKVNSGIAYNISQASHETLHNCFEQNTEMVVENLFVIVWFFFFYWIIFFFSSSSLQWTIVFVISAWKSNEAVLKRMRLR